MAKPTAQQCHALTTYFVNKCGEKGLKVTVNRNKARYGFEGLLMDYTSEQARELVDYYVDRYSDIDLTWFLYNYDKVDNDKQDYEESKSRQEIRRKATQERLERWKNKW